MKQIGVAIIGTGWCGGIRAETSASSAAFSAYVAAETQRWGKLAKESGATVD